MILFRYLADFSYFSLISIILFSSQIIPELRKDIKNILTNQTTAISMCFVLIPQDLESLSLISRLKT
jgi:hypothetical protein